MIHKVRNDLSGEDDVPKLHEWTVASALIEGPEGLLLVENLRHNGQTDWTPPGGVIELREGESILAGLTREVEEETGLRVTEWDGPLYEVTTMAPAMGWLMRVEVHRAVSYEGALRIGDDPDGIVIGAAWGDVDACEIRLEGGHPWVREPLVDWLRPDVVEASAYRYRLDGSGMHDAVVERLA